MGALGVQSHDLTFDLSILNLTCKFLWGLSLKMLGVGSCLYGRYIG